MILDRIAPNRKPAFNSVQINRAHPAQSLVAAMLMNEGAGTMLIDLLGQPGGTFGATKPVWALAPFGLGLKFVNPATVDLPQRLGLSVFTLVTRLVVPVLNDNWGIIGSAGANVEWRIDSVTGKMTLLKQGVAGIGTATTGLVAGAPSGIAVSYDASGNYQFVLNGAPVGSGNNLQVFPWASPPALGRGDGGGGYTLEFFYWFNQALPLPLMQWLTEEQDAVLTPKGPRPWMLATAQAVTPPPVVIVPPTGFGGGAGGADGGNFQSWGPTCDPAMVPAALKYDRWPAPNCPRCGRLMENRQLRSRRRAWRCPEIYWDPYTGQWEHKYVGGLWLPPVARPTIPGAPPPEQETRPHRPRRVK
jgi:hypothetical protein